MASLFDELRITQGGDFFPKLALPPASLKIECFENGLRVYDTLRRKWLRLTPEEWVRQHFIHYLCDYKGYPSFAFACEVGLPKAQRKGRTDTIVFGSKGRPWVIIEYKAAHLSLQQDMFSQLVAYNIHYGVDFLCLTNGIKQIICKLCRDSGDYHFLPEMPCYSELEAHYRSSLFQNLKPSN